MTNLQAIFEGRKVILIYINVKKSWLTLIPPFLRDLKNIYEKILSKDLNPHHIGYLKALWPTSQLLFLWYYLVSTTWYPVLNSFSKNQLIPFPFFPNGFKPFFLLSPSQFKPKSLCILNYLISSLLKFCIMSSNFCAFCSL